MTQRTDTGDSPPIESRDDLLSVFSGGEKARADWRIGTEHEKFVYRMSDHGAPSYDEPGGIRDLLMGLTEFGWRPVIEGGKVFLAESAPWLDDYLDNMAAFPKGDHDDDVDSTTQALNWMIGRSDAMGLFRYYENEAAKLKGETIK